MSRIGLRLSVKAVIRRHKHAESGLSGLLACPRRTYEAKVEAQLVSDRDRVRGELAIEELFRLVESRPDVELGGR